LDTAADTPPIRKSMRKFPFSLGAAMKIGEAVDATADRSVVAPQAGIMGYWKAAFE